MPGEHLSPAELAARLGVPLATIYGWNYTGDGPRYMKLGRHVRYRLADVERWEQEQMVKQEPAGRGRI